MKHEAADGGVVEVRPDLRPALDRVFRVACDCPGTLRAAGAGQKVVCARCGTAMRPRVDVQGEP
jgi:hypothetical protein